jgi:TonB family protein
VYNQQIFQYKNMKNLSCISTLFLLLMVGLSHADAQTKRQPAVKKTTVIPTKNPAIRVIKPNQTIIGGVVNGKATSLPKPLYPEEARKLRISGIVSVEVLIDESGNVISAKATKGVDNLSLMTAAENAAMQAKFSPTTLGGKPVKVSGIITYNFVDKNGYEDETKFVLIGMMFTLIQNFTTDLDKFKSIFEIKDFKSEFGGERKDVNEPILNAIGDDVQQLANIENVSISERKAIIDKIIFSTKARLSSDNLWQYQLGENFGEMIVVFMKATNGESMDVTKIDESSVNLSISKMKDLLFSAPPEFPAKVLQKFNEFTSDSNKINIKKPESYTRFAEKLMALLETISPD